MTSRKMLLAESADLIDVKVNLVKDRLWVHEINKHRLSEGEFHTLFNKLKNHPIKFFENCRMSEPTFYIILEAIRSEIEKQDTNFRKAIPVEERLFLTLR
ncbi:protein ALP1-like isoform X1 [Aphis craccivora]|uniref:Protein ALP1-like isoform X1 n=1 Tax=Aphis craccivora TaxID=307492 RepID=A0A6G0YCD4_APHCR|nr:protein ALP1-like isoform X1 [Aphis craccivora]